MLYTRLPPTCSLSGATISARPGARAAAICTGARRQRTCTTLAWPTTKVPSPTAEGVPSSGQDSCLCGGGKRAWDSQREGEREREQGRAEAPTW